MTMCCDFSKSFRPDKIPCHVFETDEDFEKDEVRRIFCFTYSALRFVKKADFTRQSSNSVPRNGFLVRCLVL